MTEIAFFSFGLDLTHFLLGIVAIFVALRLLDKLAAHRFTLALEKMYENPLALGLYLGLRFAGACLYASAFVH